MKRVKVTHYYQDSAYCAVAACATAANYYNKDMHYETAKKIAHEKISNKIAKEGLESGQIGDLLNELGFDKVTIISTNLDIFDYGWSKYGKKRLLKTLKDSIKNKVDEEEIEMSQLYYDWLVKEDCDNNLIIDYEFGKHIRSHLYKKKPVVICFNWTMFFRFAKENEKEEIDTINGTGTEHAVVAYGFDAKGVNICDSHHKFYKYSRKKYRKGYYKIPWEVLMTIMGQGDVILPDKYEIYELE